MQFTLFRIPIYIHPTFWLFLLIFSGLFGTLSSHTFLIVIVLVLSLLVHEFGHALAARRYGASPIIILEAFGGKAQFDPRGISSKELFLITLAGPVFESLLIIIPYTILSLGWCDHSPLAQYLCYITYKLNLLWCGFNLIPLHPLDGGPLLTYLMQKKWGDRGVQLSLIIGIIVGAAFLPFFFLQGYFVFSLLLCLFIAKQIKLIRPSGQTRRKQKSYSKKDSSPLALYNRAIDARRDGDIQEAIRLLKKLCLKKDSPLYPCAVETLAKLYHDQGQDRESYRLLSSLNTTEREITETLFYELAFAEQDYLRIAKEAHESYARFPRYTIALLNAKACGYLKEAALAGGWLNTATQFPESESLDKLLQDVAFKEIRNNPLFTSYVEQIAKRENKLEITSLAT